MSSEYEEGNEFYRSGNYYAAISSYSRAINVKLLEDDIAVRVLLNRAQCYIKIEQHGMAITDCNVLLDNMNLADSFKHKSLMRRAYALESLGNYTKALLDVEEVLANSPPKSFIEPAIRIRSRLKSFISIDNDVASKAGRPKLMVTKQQALRMCFIQQPPKAYEIGKAYLLRLCITNELGLWDRSAMQQVISDDNCKEFHMPALVGEVLMASSPPSSSSSQEPSDSVLLVELTPVVHSGSRCAHNHNLSIGVDGKVDVMVTLRMSCNVNNDDNDDNNISDKKGLKSPIHAADGSVAAVVMLKFWLDRPMPGNGDVLPVLTLPTKVQFPESMAALLSDADSPPTAASDAAAVDDRFFNVIPLCEAVHATCVRQIPIELPSKGTSAFHDSGNGHGTSSSSISSSINADRDKERNGNQHHYHDHYGHNQEVSATASASSAFALESPGFLGIAGKVWDSMYVLLQYLMQHDDEFVRGKRIIELGCGTGLAGIALCLMEPQSVLLTDLPDVKSFIAANILLNTAMASHARAKSILASRYATAAYTWGNALSLEDGADSADSAILHANKTTASATTCTTAAASTPAGVDREVGGGFVTSSGLAGADGAAAADGEDTVSASNICTHRRSLSAAPSYFDVILASDVVYYPEGYQPLLATLCDLLTATEAATATFDDAAAAASMPQQQPQQQEEESIGPVCILAHRHRHPEDKRFFDALYAQPELHVEKLEFSIMNPQQERIQQSDKSSIAENSSGGDADSSIPSLQASTAFQDVVLFKIRRRAADATSSNRVLSSAAF